MYSSLEEAIALFKRWQEENIRVHAMLSVGKGKVTVTARDTSINFSADGCTLTVENQANHFFLEIPLGEIETCQYVTARDFWSEARTQTGAVLTGDDGSLDAGLILTIRDEDDVVVAIFEQVMPN
jgi:hypothetical protein